MIKKNSIFLRLVMSNIGLLVIVILTISSMSFYISQKLIIDTFTSANRNMLEQMVSNFDDFHTQIVSISNHIRLSKSVQSNLSTKPDNDLERYNMLHDMQNYYKFLDTAMSNYNLHIVTAGINNMAYASNLESPVIDPQKISDDYFTYFPHNLGIYYDFYPGGITHSTVDKPVVVASKILKHQYSNPYGVLLISIDESRFSNIYTQSLSPGNTISIIKDNGLIISSSDKELIGTTNNLFLEKSQYIIDNNLTYTNLKYNDIDYIFLAQYIPHLGGYIVNTINKDIALSTIFKMKSFILILSIFIFIFTILATFFSSRKISLPLTKVIAAMAKTKDSNFSERIHPDGNYEVRVLGSTFNTMLDEIEKHIAKLIEVEENRRKAELYALQMQINPHFLYNTLSAIKYLAWHGNSDQVATTIDALISLLQNTIGEVDEIITIKEEIENLKNYIIIIQTRYGDNITVSFDISPECELMMVPKLIFQPFIENAFFHAFNNISNGIIAIHRIGEELICEIIDNGDGIEPHKLPDLVAMERQKKHFTGIGITNVNERIKILYGKRYGVHITSEKGIGTCVTINLPII